MNIGVPAAAGGGSLDTRIENIVKIFFGQEGHRPPKPESAHTLMVMKMIVSQDWGTSAHNLIFLWQLIFVN